MIKTGFRRAAGLALVAASVALLAPAPAFAGGKAREIPGKGTTPAFTCISMIIDEQGHTWEPKITRASGSLKADGNSLKLVRALKYRQPPAERSDVQILIKFYGNGTFAMHTFWPGEPVHEIGSTQQV